MSRWVERLRSRWAAFAHDLLMVPASWLTAYWLRFNLSAIPLEYRDTALSAILPIVLIEGAVFWSLGLYRGVWRFASLPDLERILKAVALGTLLSLLALFAINRLHGVPRSVPVLFALLQLLLLAGPRVLYRWLKDRRLDLRTGERVLIVGAGRAGEMLVRDMLRDRSKSYVPVGFVDDNPRRLGSDVQGMPVIGTTDQIPELVRDEAVDLILLAVPSATSQQMRRIVALCEEARAPFRTVPQLESLMSGRVSIQALRDVAIEDLLGRELVQLDREGIATGLAGKAVLVTGAGGSIGSELCRQIAQIGPERLVLLENCEHNLYQIDSELRRSFPSLALHLCLGDVTDPLAVESAFRHAEPNIVFHAAAYKHVPLLEGQARQAVRNNVLGTMRVAQAAAARGVDRFVLISTDKAVSPSNVMGATKRVAELYCQCLTSESRTRFIAVRFGNVLGSAGSVVPLFRAQIAAGGPVTVTDPEVERFFMTIPEACQLILQAAVLGEGGEVFVLDMGEPVKIRYLAEQMIRLSGKRPELDVPIHYIGLRPGEKLYEELFYEDEDLHPTPHPKIRMARPPLSDPELLRQRVERLAAAADSGDPASLQQQLRELVNDGTHAHANSTSLPQEPEK